VHDFARAQVVAAVLEFAGHATEHDDPVACREAALAGAPGVGAVAAEPHDAARMEQSK